MQDAIGNDLAERKKAYYKSWYALNRARKIAQVTAYRQSAPGRVQRRAYSKKNRERINAVARTRTRAPRTLELALLYRAKHRAKRDGLPFSIVVEDIKVPTHCPVLGMKLQLGARRAKDASPSLDRLVPARGYVRGNVAVISWRANMLKSGGTAEEHRRIAEYMENAK